MRPVRRNPRSWRSIAECLGWLAVASTGACVGQPPSPPLQSASSSGSESSSGSIGAATATEPAPTDSSSTAAGTEDGTSSLADEGSTTQGLQPETSTGATTSTSGATEATSTGMPPGTSTGTSPSCDDLYGAAPGYLLCMETEDECHFNAQTNGSNCNAMCGMLGGACLAAFDDVAGTCQILRPSIDTCDTNRATEICVCSK